MLKVPITFETITPLFTGDCNQKMTEIKPASIMGSLRFWFEVICHFSGKFNQKEYSKNELDSKDFKEFMKNKPDANDEDIRKKICLSPTALYFGCTGWKSQIGIEKIEKIYQKIPAKIEKNDFTISKLVDSEKENPNLYGKKIFLNCGKKDENGNPKESGWFLPKQYFRGQFQITFLLSDSSLKNNILFPLLQFIQEYGFLGGKNNIGFGRVKILEPSIANGEKKSSVFLLSFRYLYQPSIANKEEQILKEMIDYSSLIKSNKLKEKVMKELTTYCSDKIEVLWLQEEPKKKHNHKIKQQNNEPFYSALEKYEEDNFDETDYKPQYTYFDSIKCLLLLKSKMRRNINFYKKRHFYFGSKNNDKYFERKKEYEVTGPNATKIIPLIREKERGFLAIPGIISMEEKNDDTKQM